MPKAKTDVVQVIELQRLETAEAEICLYGKNLLMNRMPKKAREQLLLPPRQVNRRARQATLKHNPPEEFRDAVYRCRDDKAPTYLHMPEGSIKRAISQAAIDIPGATKAEIGRLVQVISPTVHIWGKPFLHMGVVRMANVGRTPDIRTRAMLPQWCAVVRVRYVRSLIREQDIVNLFDAAGLIVGIGDGRGEKGYTANGSWELVQKTDKRFLELQRTQGRAVQLAAMQNPTPYDEDSAELLSWFEDELVRREIEPTKRDADDAFVPKTRAKKNGKGRVVHEAVAS